MGIGAGLIAGRFGRNEAIPEPVVEPPSTVAAPEIELPPEPPLPAGAVARLGTALFQGSANHLVFASDGKSFFTSSWSGAKEIDLSTGRVVRAYSAPPLLGDSLERWVTPDGKFLIEKETAMAWTEEPVHSKLRIREWPGGKLLQETSVPSGSLKLSPDGTAVAAASVGGRGYFSDPAVFVCKLPHGRCKTVRLRSENRSLVTAAFRPMTGEVLIVDREYGEDLSYANARLRRWNFGAEPPVEIGAFSFPGNEAGTRLAVSADGRWLAAVADVDASERRPGRLPKLLIVQDTRLQIWDINRGERIAHPELGHERLWHLSFLPDGSILTVGSADGNGIVRVRETPDWRQTIGWLVPNWQAGLSAVSPDGQTLILSTQSGHIRRFDIPSAREYPSRPTHSVPVNEITFADDGTVVTWAKELNWRKDVPVSTESLAWDPATGRPREMPAGMRKPDAGPKYENPPPERAHVVREPAGRYTAAVWGHWDQPQTVAVWDNASGRQLWQAEFPRGVYPMGFSPGARHLFLNNRALVAVETASGREDFRWDLVGRGIVTRNGLSTCSVWTVPGGEQLLVRTYFDGLRLVDARSGTLRHKLDPHAREPLAFSSVGRLVAATLSSESGTIAVWNVATGELRKTFVTDHGRVSALAFDASGRWLVSGGYDGTALVWDATTK